MKICVFGGMFDPPHIGHEEIIAKLVKKFDKIIIVPSKVTPAKEHKPAVSDFHRIKMLSLCNFLNASKCVISEYEITSCNSPSYSINTLKYIKSQFKKSDISIAIGLDQFYNFNSWYESKEIISLAKIVCFNRRVEIQKKISVNFALGTFFIAYNLILDMALKLCLVFLLLLVVQADIFSLL